jgi:abequosyltransferase
VKISFCIPTYNHARFLGAALDSILRQAPDDFEIVIVDGASTDDTPQVVAEYQCRSPHIVYHRCAQNGGVDRDLALALQLARGEYCWLGSSDDVIADGAVARIVAELHSGHALYVGGRLECTKDLVTFARNDVFGDLPARSWDFSDEEQLLHYLNSANTLIAAFSYISVLIFRKDLWQRAGDNTEFLGSCYAHAHRLWRGLASGGLVRFVREPLVRCRMDTDHFASRGVFRRFMLDFEGYRRIADDVFPGRPRVREAFLGVVRREHGTLRLAKFYRACATADERNSAQAIVTLLGYSSGQRLSMQVIAACGPLLDTAVAVRRGLRRRLGGLRY